MSSSSPATESEAGSALRESPPFRRLTLAVTTSNIGDGVTLAATPLLALSISDSAAFVSSVVVAAGLPWLLASLPAGLLVDRVNKRSLMIGVDLVRGLVLVLLATAAVTDRLSAAWLLATVFILGVGQVVFANAYQSILPSLIPAGQLQHGNGVLSVVETLGMRFAGPPLGALLFQWHPALPFLVDGASFLVGALWLTGVPRSAGDRGDGGSPAGRGEILGGVRWLWRHRFLLWLGLVISGTNLAYTASSAVLVVVAARRLELGAAGYGLLLSVGALGAVVGGASAGRMAQRVSPAGILVFGLLIAGAGDLLVAATAVPLVAGLGLALGGCVGAMINVTNATLRQRYVPADVIGRVTSVLRLVSWGAIPLGGVVGGVVASAFGAPAAYVFSGLTMIALVLPLIPIVRSPDYRRAVSAGARSP